MTVIIPINLDDITTIDRDALRAEVLRIKEAEGKSWTVLATESGLKSGTLSNWVGGTYAAGDDSRVVADIARWLKSRTERQAAAAVLPKAPDFIETPTARNILAHLIFAHTAPDIAVYAGGAGIGKTATARHYQRHHSNVHLFTMRPTTSGVHTMLAEMAEVMGIEERMANRLARAIGRKVQGANALLIIDEAQHLATAALDELRSLHDGWGVGIALLGNEMVYSRIEGQGRQSSLSQLFSRVGKRKSQPKVRPGDVAALAAGWCIDDGKILARLEQIGAKPGALRGLTKTLRLAVMIAEAEGVMLTEAHVVAAWRDLGNQGD